MKSTRVFEHFFSFHYYSVLLFFVFLCAFIIFVVVQKLLLDVTFAE